MRPPPCRGRGRSDDGGRPPPELIERLIDQWSRGAQVVWAARRASQSVATIYYWVMRRIVGLRGMPPHGADFFLVDRTVLDAFRGFSERNISVLALITWLGFSQASIEYDKQPRGSGRSAWSFSRKIRLVVDSVTAFSDFPVRLCGIAGVALLIIAVIASIIALTMLSDVAAIGLLIAAT